MDSNKNMTCGKYTLAANNHARVSERVNVQYKYTHRTRCYRRAENLLGTLEVSTLGKRISHAEFTTESGLQYFIFFGARRDKSNTHRQRQLSQNSAPRRDPCVV
jgi:hypothetical protein